MAKRLYEENNIQDLANAIREKNGSTDKYRVDQMAGKVRELEARKPEQEKTLDVTENSVVEVLPDDGKVMSKVTVNVNLPKLGWSFEELMTTSAPTGDLVYNETDFNASIVAQFFNWRTGITSVTMENVTGNLPSFRGCSSLSYIYFPKVTSLNSQEFNGAGFSGIMYMNKMTPAVTKLSGSACFNNLPNVTRIILPETVQTIAASAFNSGLTECADICFLGTPTTIPANAIVGTNTIAAVKNIYVPWAEGAVANAPWGATNATIHYNTTYDADGNPVV